MSDRWDVNLVGELTRLAAPDNPNRAGLAQLRRGLGEAPAYVLARVGWLFRAVPDAQLGHALVAAGLFAWVKGVCPQRDGINFGAAFGSGLSQDDKAARERRFIDLLDTPAGELPYKLRQAVTLIGRTGVGLDWVMLMNDLRRWEYDDRRVQKDWARGFWGAAEKAGSEDQVETIESTT
jgi:CRISPR type I-E-associated protein CasB/Cse2